MGRCPVPQGPLRKAGSEASLGTVPSVLAVVTAGDARLGVRGGAGRMLPQAGEEHWPPTPFSSKIPWLVGQQEGQRRQGRCRGTQLLGCSFARATPHAAKTQALPAQRCWSWGAPWGVCSRAQWLCRAVLAWWGSPGELILYFQAPLAQCPGSGQPGRAAKWGLSCCKQWL